MRSKIDILKVHGQKYNLFKSLRIKIEIKKFSRISRRPSPLGLTLEIAMKRSGGEEEENGGRVRVL